MIGKYWFIEGILNCSLGWINDPVNFIIIILIIVGSCIALMSVRLDTPGATISGKNQGEIWRKKKRGIKEFCFYEMLGNLLFCSFLYCKLWNSIIIYWQEGTHC